MPAEQAMPCVANHHWATNAALMHHLPDRRAVQSSTAPFARSRAAAGSPALPAASAGWEAETPPVPDDPEKETIMRRPRRFDYRRNLRAQPMLLLAFAGVGLAATEPQQASAPQQKAAPGGLPLSFEANNGQTDAAVKFLSRGNGYALFLTRDSAVFKLRSFQQRESPAVVRMKLAGANRDPRVSGADALPGIVNYFMGSDPGKWIKSVSTFGSVNYRQIYPGIDLVYYGTQRQLEFDFVVAPGADPKQIGLEFSGAKPMLGMDGSLMLRLNGDPLVFRKPVIYQTIAGKKKMIAGNYKLSGGRVQFALGKYDHNRTLVSIRC
jgi:hypothetical protein